MADREPTVNVTSAGLSGSDDRALRQKRYIVTQAIRMAAFLLAVFLPVPLWAKLLLIAAAFTLPWMGVIAANAGPTVQPRRRAEAVPESAVVLRPVVDAAVRTIDQEP